MEARSHIGRPRDTSVDARVLSAAFELLKKVGFSEMTMDAVATAAGIDKPAIYRRWSSKEELAIAALSAGKPLLDQGKQVLAVDRGSLGGRGGRRGAHRGTPLRRERSSCIRRSSRVERQRQVRRTQPAGTPPASRTLP